MSENPENSTSVSESVSEKGFVPALLLCLFLGGFGLHRFYVGKVTETCFSVSPFYFCMTSVWYTVSAQFVRSMRTRGAQHTKCV